MSPGMTLIRVQHQIQVLGSKEGLTYNEKMQTFNQRKIIITILAEGYTDCIIFMEIIIIIIIVGSNLEEEVYEELIV